jgi:hypothetical protein
VCREDSVIGFTNLQLPEHTTAGGPPGGDDIVTLPPCKPLAAESHGKKHDLRVWDVYVYGEIQIRPEFEPTMFDSSST